MLTEYDHKLGQLEAKVEALQNAVTTLGEHLRGDMRLISDKIEEAGKSQARARRQIDADIAKVRLETTAKNAKNAATISGLVALAMLALSNGAKALFGRLM